MKTCKHPSCSYPVFGKGYCKSHQYLRIDKKPKKILARTEKKPFHKIDWGFTSQIDLFSALWDANYNENGFIICKYTGEKLNKYFNTEQLLSCCAHLLNKKNWPLFKYNPENIRIVFPEFHRIVDQGTMEDRKAHPDWNFDLWDKEVLDMKEKYLTFKKQNLLA
jgi:hypothetical protein